MHYEIKGNLENKEPGVSFFPMHTIGDVCAVGDGAHAKVSRRDSGIMYLTSKNIGMGRLDLSIIDFIGEEDFEKLFSMASKATRRPQTDDILIGIIGTFGNVYRYKGSDRFGISSSIAILRPYPSMLDSLFLYYVISSKFFKAIHQAYKGGSAQGYTNIPTIKRLPIPLPPLSEQQAIAHILGSLDDKIELNRQMNQTLEGIARALFKSWFVDFDPVRAKMAGRMPYGMDAETAALFPDGFEDSVLGAIPKGWRIGNPQTIADITMGQSPPSEAYNEGGNGLPFYQGIRDFGFRFPSKRVYCNIAGRIAEKGDVLLSVRAPVGSLNIAAERCIIGRGLAALHPKSKTNGFLYYILKETQSAWDVFNANGTVFGSISKNDIQKFNLNLPPQAIEQRFNDIVYAIDCRIELNESEIITLTNLRDTLLPKLLSGEIRVRDAEKEVGVVL